MMLEGGHDDNGDNTDQYGDDTGNVDSDGSNGDSDYKSDSKTMVMMFRSGECMTQFTYVIKSTDADHNKGENDNDDQNWDTGNQDQ